MRIFEKFRLGFKKVPTKFQRDLKKLLLKEIDDKKLDEIEEFLISADVGIEASSKIKSLISQKIDPNLDQHSEINKILKEFIISLMQPLENKDFLIKKIIMK